MDFRILELDKNQPKLTAIFQVTANDTAVFFEDVLDVLAFDIAAQVSNK
jgi:hypothetical protein